MRSTTSHVFFWYGPFSNWHKPSYFSGASALEVLLPMLRELDVPYPDTDDRGTETLVAHRFHCGEQWMMAVKAWLFGDFTRLKLILDAYEPKQQKALGRLVSPFCPNVWEKICVPVVAAGTVARAEASPALREQFLATGDRIFVEGSPYDRLWGVGIKWDDPRIEDPSNWRGRNLLGQAHGIARAMLAERMPAKRGLSR